MGRRSKKTDILEVSEKLFVNPGIEKVKIIDICEKAGISKVTFYKHFRNKEDLVNSLLDKMYEEDKVFMQKILDTSPTFRDEIEQMIDYEVNVRDMNFYVNNIDYLNKNGVVRNHMDYIFEKRLEQGLEWIKLGKEKGRINADVKPEFILAIFKKFFEMTEDKELLQHYKSGKELMKDIDHFFFYGIVGERE